MRVLYDHPQAGVAWGCAITFTGDMPPSESPASVVMPVAPRFLLQSMLFRRSALGQVGGFDPSLRLGEDVDWLFRAMEHSVPLVIHGDLVVYYRRHSANLTSDAGETGRGLNVLNVLLKRSLDRRRVQRNLALERRPTLLILPSVKDQRYAQTQKP